MATISYISNMIYLYIVYLTMDSTTIKVSKNTLKSLGQLQRILGKRTLDDTVRELIKQRRKALLAEAFSLDKGKIKQFAETDRGEDRY